MKENAQIVIAHPIKNVLNAPIVTKHALNARIVITLAPNAPIVIKDVPNVQTVKRTQNVRQLRI
tara:strand:- start:283 stop:474 length:192 start_codon:yes stop_codon:yes gene_type:complete